MWQLDPWTTNNTPQFSFVPSAFQCIHCEDHWLADFRTLFYADDILVYCLGRDWEQVVGQLQTELDHTGRWCGQVTMLVNLTKAAVT